MSIVINDSECRMEGNLAEITTDFTIAIRTFKEILEDHFDKEYSKQVCDGILKIADMPMDEIRKENRKFMESEE